MGSASCHKVCNKNKDDKDDADAEDSDTKPSPALFSKPSSVMGQFHIINMW